MPQNKPNDSEEANLARRLVKVVKTQVWKPGDNKPTAAELDELRREKPLQAAVYLAQTGQSDEVDDLVLEAQRRIKEEVAHILEEKYKAQSDNDKKRLKELQDQITNLQQFLEPLLEPPLSRAVLVRAYKAPLPVDAQVERLQSSIDTLKDFNKFLQTEEMSSVIALLEEKLVDIKELQASSKAEELLALPDLDKDDKPNTPEDQKAVQGYRAVIATTAGRFEVNVSQSVSANAR